MRLTRTCASPAVLSHSETGSKGILWLPGGGDNLKAVTWHLYLLRCGDGTLYCGIALDVAARLRAHQEGRGARYTKGRGPLELIHAEACGSKGDALRRERDVKALPRHRKLALAAGAEGPWVPP